MICDRGKGASGKSRGHQASQHQTATGHHAASQKTDFIPAIDVMIIRVNNPNL